MSLKIRFRKIVSTIVTVFMIVSLVSISSFVKVDAEGNESRTCNEAVGYNGYDGPGPENQRPPCQYYGVTYKYEAESGTLPGDLTTSSAAYGVSDNAKYKRGDIVYRKNPTNTVYYVKDQGIVTGKWELKKWNPTNNSVVMGDKGLTFTGIWTYSEAKRYSVKYEYVSDSTSVALPSEISTINGDYAISDPNTYFEGAVVNPVAGPSQTPYKEKDKDGRVIRIWTFKKWSQTSPTMTTNGVTITGTWTCKKAATYPVKYEYKSGSPNVALPSEISTINGDYAISDPNTYFEGATVSPVADFSKRTYKEKDRNGRVIRIWTFKDWSQTSPTMTTSGVTITGTWTCQNAATYPVKYEYKSGSPNVALPSEISTINGDYAISDPNTYFEGAKVSPIADFSKRTYKEKDRYGRVIRIWTFKGWSQTSPTMTTSGVTITGIWTCKKADTYPVKYEYKSDSKKVALPRAISTTKGEYAISDNRTYLEGDIVYRVKGPRKTTYKEKDKHGRVIRIWTLTKWNKDRIKMTDQGITFVGTWTCKKADTYSVKYEYKSGSTNVALPSEISTLTGEYAISDSKTYLEGTKVNRVEGPNKTTYKEKDDNGRVIRVWTLTKWNKDKIEMTDQGITFVGTWTYQDAAKYSVTYEYKAASGTLPPEISTLTGDYAISDSDTYFEGEKVNRVNGPAKTTFDVKKNGVIVGTWTLTKWNEEQNTMTPDGLTFVGTWTYKENVIQVNTTDKKVETQSVKTSSSSAVKTGDESNYLNCMLLAGISFVGIILNRKRSKE
ncbi:MAG: SHIRT domain-containing protein [Thomasclavelia sp.]|nr:SHIRT domain-containing protein [Thomasclavelia sp.]